MTSLPELLAAVEPIDGGFRTTIPANWLQGRTAYGGLSSALAVHAAMLLEPDLPPLRSAQIAFIGPLAAAVTVVAQRLRRGRNAAFLQVDITAEASLGYRAIFVFMAGHPSRLTLDETPRSAVPPPDPDERLWRGHPDHFTANFAYRDRKEDAPGAAEWLRWVRLEARGGLAPAVELLMIGDALPPAALKLLGGELAPLSSINWTINLLAADPVTTDGWWLIHTATDRALHGGSSQRMTIWNAAGAPVADAIQSVAIFA